MCRSELHSRLLRWLFFIVLKREKNHANITTCISTKESKWEKTPVENCMSWEKLCPSVCLSVCQSEKICTTTRHNRLFLSPPPPESFKLPHASQPSSWECPLRAGTALVFIRLMTEEHFFCGVFLIVINQPPWQLSCEWRRFGSSFNLLFCSTFSLLAAFAVPVGLWVPSFVYRCLLSLPHPPTPPPAHRAPPLPCFHPPICFSSHSKTPSIRHANPCVCPSPSAAPFAWSLFFYLPIFSSSTLCLSCLISSASEWRDPHCH